MKIGELFKSENADHLRMVESEVNLALSAFPGANGDPLKALAFAAWSLRKNLNERTAERDQWREQYNAAVSQ